MKQLLLIGLLLVFGGLSSLAAISTNEASRSEPPNRVAPSPHELERLLSPSLSSIRNGGEGGRRPGEGVVHDEKAALQPVANPKPILDDLQRKMSALTSVYLEFTQERRLQLFTEPLKSEGVMLIQRPGQIRWETTAPYQSILLGNAKSVAQFEKTDGEWKKLKLGFPEMLKRVMNQMTLMHQGKLDALTSDYTISVATGAVAVVTMVPKDQNVRAMLASLEIRMRPDLSATREVVMNEPGGDLTRIIFRHEKRDVAFPTNTFDQTKPLDVAAIKTAVGNEP
jgi:outer membrane lipoprotein-sorting protein